jgi:chaperonin GroEL
MVHRPNIDPNLAFVLIPFKAPFDDYYEDIIRPAAKAIGLATLKADEIYGTGPIIQDIWKQIWAATVVIADVTGKNPNVNYELGICHTLGVPTVIITQSMDDVPFDYRHRRCIPYSTDGSTWQRDLKKSITATLKQVIAGEDLSPELSWPYDTSSPRTGSGTRPLTPASDARDAVVHGTRLVRDAVAYAFGPRGGHVSTGTGQDEPRSYKRGTDIAGLIQSSQKSESTGISLARRVATEMRNNIGDGAKTAVLLFHKMVDGGSVALKRNHPRADVLRGMERAAEAAVSAIRGCSKPLAGDMVMHVARTSACGDSTIAALVVDAYRKAGRDGFVVVERTTQKESTLDFQEGMQFDRGRIDASSISPADAREWVLDNAYILTYGSKISSLRDLLPLLEQIANVKRPLLVIADDVEGEALATIVVNRQRGTLDCLAVKAPGFGDSRSALLQDIAVLTGGVAITLSSGRKLENVALQDLGQARKVIVTKESTTILGGAGEAKMHDHVAGIREALSRAHVPFDIEKLRERLAKLSGAIAAIRVGGISPQEVDDRAYAAESSMHSVQRAIEEGAVLGGGLSLIRAKSAVSRLLFKRPGEVVGVSVMEDALEEPLRRLAANSRLNPDEVTKRVKRAKKSGTGLNSETGKLQDLGSAGILDPAATVCYAIRLAFSHARVLLETEAWDSSGPKIPKQPDDTLIGWDMLELDTREEPATDS